ncbi:ATP-binding protein [Variovorax rhizosphaerae]|uniref:ATP-binding protein n=1 Tax=Variovorax rhizosphaerae TaxID=1836200 RepID=A0ABU8WEC7_9BURK
MAEPSKVEGSALEVLWSSATCFGSAFLGGVIGNLAASLLWETGKWVGKRSAKALLDKVPELSEILSGGGQRPNHDLLRALRRAECAAMSEIIDRCILAHAGIELSEGKIKAFLQLRTQSLRDPTLDSLCTLRRMFRGLHRRLREMPNDELERLNGGATNDLPGIVRSASECFAADDVETLRRTVVDNFVTTLESAVMGPGRFSGLSKKLEPVLREGFPTILRDHLYQHPNGWWDYLRTAFREELKDPANERARTAWELDVQSRLQPQLGPNWSELSSRLDVIDASIDREWALLVSLRNEFDEFAEQVLVLLKRIDEQVGVLVERFEDLDERIRAQIGASAAVAISPGAPLLPRPLPVAHKPVGRDEELTLLREQLADPATKMLRIIGRAGAGKTTLVAYVLNDLLAAGGGAEPGRRAAFDAVLFIRCHENESQTAARILEGADEVLRKLGLPAVSTSGQDTSARAKFARFAEETAALRILIFLDNLESAISVGDGALADPDLNDLFVELMEGGEHVRLAYTSRTNPSIRAEAGLVPIEQLRPERQRQVDLATGLADAAAVDLLRRQDPQGVLGLRDAPVAMLLDIVRSVGGNPKAIELIRGAVEAGRVEPAQVARFLADARGSHAVFGDLLEALIGVYYEKLSRIEIQFLQALAVYGTPVSLHAVAHVLTECGAAITEELTVVQARLLRHRLIRRTGETLDQHDAERTHLIGSLPSSQTQDGVASMWTRERLMESATRFWQARCRPESTWTSIADLEPQFREIDLLKARGAIEQAAAVTLGTAGFLTQRGYHLRLRGMLSAIEAQRDAAMSVAMRGRVGCALADSLGRLGVFDQAKDVSSRTLSLLVDADLDRIDVVRAKQCDARCELELGRISNAIDDLESADAQLQQCRDTGVVDAALEVRLLGDLAFAKSIVGDIRGALSLAQRAEALAACEGDVRGLVRGTAYSGLYLSYAGDFAAARSKYRDAISLGKKAGGGYELVLAYGLSSETELVTGNSARAIELALSALEIERDINNVLSGSWCKWLIASALSKDADKLEAAEQLAREALTFNRPLNNPNPRALLGILRLRQADRKGARILDQVVEETSQLLRSCPANWEAHCAQGWALLGLASQGECSHADGIAAYARARKASPSSGHLWRIRLQITLLGSLLADLSESELAQLKALGAT